MMTTTNHVRKLAALGVSLGTILCASQARAAEFGERGQFIVSADRLFPLLSFSDVQQNEFGTNVKDTYQQSSLSLFVGSTPPQDTFYTVPRLGLDYVITSHLTVGGDVVLYTTLGTSGSTGNNSSGSGPTTFLFGLAPRVGYVLAFSDMFAFWPRGGLSWYTTSSNGPGDTGGGLNQLALDLDPQFVITPVSHFGFTAGVTADIPLTGGHSVTENNTTTSAGASILFVGATVGMLGYF